MPHLTRRSWLAVTVGVVGLVALGVTIAGAQTDDERTGTDPLGPTEEQAALDLAVGSGGPEAGALGADDVVLLIERHEEAKTEAGDALRRADVYVYSYDDDKLIWSVVDLESGEVVQTEQVTGNQLPLVDTEGDRAVELATADAEFSRLLATRFQQATGRPLGDPATDLEISPIIFRADAMPSEATGAAARCGIHRCAQLMIQSTDDILINLLPVVDLSADRIVSREGFFS